MINPPQSWITATLSGKNYINEKLTINICLVELMQLIQEAIKLSIPLKYLKNYNATLPDSILQQIIHKNNTIILQ